MNKCLFVMRRAGIGGTATSLLHLLSLYHEKGILYDVFLFTHDGEFTSEIAEVSTLLPEDKDLAAVFCAKNELKHRGFISSLRRVCFSLSWRILGKDKTRKKLFAKCAARLSGQYDTVIAYQEDLSTDFAQYIQAPTKIAWCHMDCHHVQTASGRSDADVRNLYSAFTHIACVSTVIRDSMIGKVALPEDRISVIYNTIPPKVIRKKAEANTGDTIDKRLFTFVSMGRFVERKRFDRFVLAAEKLRERGVDFVWYLIGNGELFEEIKAMVAEKSLSEQVLLVGPKENPFVYVKHADCFVMASENEGQPMVLNEALTLGVPAITTDFPSAREVIHNNVDGLVVPNTDEGLVSGVLRFTEDEALRSTLREGANSFVYDNEGILNQVSQMIESNA